MRFQMLDKTCKIRVTVHSVHSNTLRDAQKSCIRMISRRTSRVFCELRSQKHLAECHQRTVTNKETKADEEVFCQINAFGFIRLFHRHLSNKNTFSRQNILFKLNFPIKPELFNRQKGKDQKYREQIADQVPSAVCCDQYIINPMENHTCPKPPDRASDHDPFFLKHIGDSAAKCNSAQKMKGTS